MLIVVNNLIYYDDDNGDDVVDDDNDEIDKQELKEMISEMDEDDSGTVDFEE